MHSLLGNQENLALADIQRRLTFAMAGMTGMV